MKLAKEQIVEGNILIALFLGWKIDNSFPDKGRIYRSPKGATELDTTLKFHTSFDLLIPIMKSIDEWGAFKFGGTPDGMFPYEAIKFHTDITDLTQLWLMIVHDICIINGFNGNSNDQFKWIYK